jgi:hypothetical protein
MMLIDRQNAFPPLLNLERVTRLFHLLVIVYTPHSKQSHCALYPSLGPD